MLERAAAGVETPEVVDGPQVICGKHGAQTLNRRNGGSGTGFRIKRISAARLLIDVPIYGRNMLVRTGHAHAGRFSHLALGATGGRQGGIRPVQFLENRQIISFRFFVGRIVAAIKPRDDGRMIANPPDLVAKGLFRDIVVSVLPFFPLFPEIATAPAGNNHDAFAIAQFQEPSALGFAFKPNGVEIHVFDIPDLLDFAFRRWPQKHVGSPTAATDKNGLPVNLEDAIALVV